MASKWTLVTSGQVASMTFRCRAFASSRTAGEMPCAEKISQERSEEHTSELQSQSNLVCRLLLEKKKSADPLHSRGNGGALPRFDRAVIWASGGVLLPASFVDCVTWVDVLLAGAYERVRSLACSR